MRGDKVKVMKEKVGFGLLTNGRRHCVKYPRDGPGHIGAGPPIGGPGGLTVRVQAFSTLRSNWHLAPPRTMAYQLGVCPLLRRRVHVFLTSRGEMDF